MPTTLITGTSRGIGLELVRQYAADGWDVHACCREPDGADALSALAAAARGRVRVHRLEVTDRAATDRLAAELGGTPIDVLVANAGVFGPKRSQGEQGQSFGHVDYAGWEQVLRVNTLAPLKLAEAFVEHVAASGLKRIAVVSSSLASIAGTSGGYLAYRTSKAALNMAFASLAAELAPRGILVGVFCPGWVHTDMGGPGATVPPEESVRGLRSQIAGLDARRSGRFWRYDGTPIHW
jgi:NAD(P)-dependent dehydrogenase (short-subunit alcohol dehydrogenase family)